MLVRLKPQVHFWIVPVLFAALAVSLSCYAKENESQNYIALQPLGKVDEGILNLMCRFVEVAYGSPCKVMKPLDLPSSAYSARRKQYRASELLDYIKDRVPEGARKVLGVTEKDLYTGQMNFIFGLAKLPGRYCVVSTCRLDEGFRGRRENKLLLCRRALMIVYHELGHTFGMKHCTKIQCAMCYHNSLGELDAGYVWFCEECVRKLERRLGRFAEDREAKLANLLREIGLTRDAKRYGERARAKE